MRRSARTRGTVVACAAAIVLAGCGQILGVQDYRVQGSAGAGADASGTTEAGPRCGGYAFPNDPSCGECMTSSCCNELEACRHDAACAPWEECIAACGPDNWDCHGHCGALLTHTNGAIADVVVCKTKNCGVCTHPEAAAMIGGASCVACTQQQCGDPVGITAGYAACPQCLDVVSCFLRSDISFTPNPAKLVKCNSFWMSPPAKVVQDLQYCIGLTCGLPCDMGRWLECPHQFAYPYPSASSARVRIWNVQDFFLSSGEPYVDSIINACDRTDVECASKRATSKPTGADGTVTLDVPTTPNGFTGYFEVLAKDGTVGLYVPSHPLVKDTTLVVPVPPRAVSIPTKRQPGTGMVTAILMDCFGSNIRGGGLETAGPSRVQYWNGTADAGSGITGGWLLDVPPGTAIVRGKKDGVVISEESIPIRADVVTSVVLLPHPE